MLMAQWNLKVQYKSETALKKTLFLFPTNIYEQSKNWECAFHLSRFLNNPSSAWAKNERKNEKDWYFAIQIFSKIE